MGEEAEGKDSGSEDYDYDCVVELWEGKQNGLEFMCVNVGVTKTV